VCNTNRRATDDLKKGTTAKTASCLHAEILTAVFGGFICKYREVHTRRKGHIGHALY
jgi:hypothetical protein